MATVLESNSVPGRDFAIFGGGLRSEIDLPELPLAACTRPDWIFRRASGPRPPSELLGDESVDVGIRVRCGRLRDGFRLDFTDTGIFDITDGGRLIEWRPGSLEALDFVRADLLGGVFSVALHLHGLICLHSSAVTIGGAAIAFVANKGTGKSTITAALCGAGARFITDDMLPVLPGALVTAWPSAPAVRLLPDSASRLGYAKGPIHPASGKYHVSTLPAERVEHHRLPLGAVYELAPVAPESGAPAVRRVRLAGAAAVATLLRHSRAGLAIGSAESARLFERAADVAQSVPVYRLEVARDFAQLPVVVEELNSWHAIR
jgi:hypothetical protein